MAEITAALVKELRERTGEGMMDCKKALTKAGGDIEKAIDDMRASGAIKATLPLKAPSPSRTTVKPPFCWKSTPRPTSWLCRTTSRHSSLPASTKPSLTN